MTRPVPEETPPAAGNRGTRRGVWGNSEDPGRAMAAVIGIAFLASALSALFGLAIMVSVATG